MMHRTTTLQHRLRFSLVLFVAALALLGIYPQASATPRVDVTGDITVDTTWTLANSPYLVGPNTLVTIAEQATLTIEPGVEVRFATGAGLVVRGGLQARARPSQPVRLVGEAGQRWLGVQVVRPQSDVLLRYVTLSDAVSGVLIQQTGVGGGQQGKVTIVGSLITRNTTGIVADYTVTSGAPKFTARNNLITENGVGMLVTEAPSGNSRPKLSHNSFVGNGIGLQAVGGKLKAKQQWWGSADGPLDSGSCVSLPVPRSDPRDLICGVALADYRPWTKIPAGRVLVPAPDGVSAGIRVESALGAGVVSEVEDAPTSVITLTVPTGAFTEPVDLSVSSLALEETPPGQNGPATQLAFEINAASGTSEIHTFANDQELRLEITYEAADLAGLDPASLGVLYYDEATGTWSRAGVRTTIDPASKRISAHLEHLTRFSVRSVNGYSDVWLPFVTR